MITAAVAIWGLAFGGVAIRAATNPVSVGLIWRLAAMPLMSR